MDDDMCIPLSSLLKLQSIRDIAADADALINGLKDSKLLILDEAGARVKPNMSIERNSMILRDIPSDVSAEEIAQLFDPEYCAVPINIRSDIGQTWFVTFETEDDCLRSIMHIRGLKLREQPIRCGVKSGSIFYALELQFKSRVQAEPEVSETKPVNQSYTANKKKFNGKYVPGRKYSREGNGNAFVKKTYKKEQKQTPIPDASDFPALPGLKDTNSSIGFMPASKASVVDVVRNPSETDLHQQLSNLSMQSESTQEGSSSRDVFVEGRVQPNILKQDPSQTYSFASVLKK
jgi:hypothetical protein